MHERMPLECVQKRVRLSEGGRRRTFRPKTLHISGHREENEMPDGAESTAGEIDRREGPLSP